MSFSITALGLARDGLPGGITLDDPGCVRKTFPGFHDALAELRREWAL
jgi:3-phosphoshikimate 1-carboxyvinyltransferase